MSKQDAEQAGAQDAKQMSKQDAEQASAQDAKQMSKQDAEQASAQDAKQMSKQDAEQASAQDAKQMSKQDAEQASAQDAEQVLEATEDVEQEFVGEAVVSTSKVETQQSTGASIQTKEAQIEMEASQAEDIQTKEPAVSQESISEVSKSPEKLELAADAVVTEERDTKAAPAANVSNGVKERRNPGSDFREQGTAYQRYNDDNGRSFRRRRGMRYRRYEGIDHRNLVIDYKRPDVLKAFLSEQGKILPKRFTKISTKKQRQLSLAVKRARVLALLPFK